MNKHLYSIGWFDDNFHIIALNDFFYCNGTCNGYDYSFVSDTPDMARLLAKTFLINNGHLIDEEKRSLEMHIKSLEAESDKYREQVTVNNLEVGQRHRSQLLSVYYMLDAIGKTGTHHEKRVVIRYQKSILEGLINNGDRLPFKADDFPFSDY